MKTLVIVMFQTYIDFFGQIASTNIASLILATIAMVSIHLVKEYVNPKVKAKIKMPVPVELIWVIPVLFIFIVFTPVMWRSHMDGV